MISIILPCYNVEKYVERCFFSCKVQTYKNFELIFVNDASTDQTLEKIKQLETLDKRVRVIDLKNNVGTFHARKVGYIASVGSYILFLDPDDEIYPDFLEVMQNELIESSAEMVFSKLDVKPKNIYGSDISLPDKYTGDNVFEKCIINIKNIPKGNPGKFYKRYLIDKIYQNLSFIENRFVYAEDVVFFFAAILNVNKISSVNERKYIYHVNHSSITQSRNLEKINYNINQINMAISYLEILAKNKSDIVKKSSIILCESLRYDKLSLERFICILNDEKLDYIYKSIEMLKIKIYWRNVIKIIIFALSFSKIKMK